VYYDDGDIEALDLGHEVWRLEGQGGEGPGQAKKGQRKPPAAAGAAGQKKKPTSPRPQVRGRRWAAAGCRRESSKLGSLGYLARQFDPHQRHNQPAHRHAADRFLLPAATTAADPAGGHPQESGRPAAGRRADGRRRPCPRWALPWPAAAGAAAGGAAAGAAAHRRLDLPGLGQ
jgi:hypothetical protein